MHGNINVKCSETSGYKIQTPGNYPGESVRHSEHGEKFEMKNYFTFSEQCMAIHMREKDQQEAHYFTFSEQCMAIHMREKDQQEARYFTFSEQCMAIHMREKDQQVAHFS